jgi:hypothetical protein
MAYRPALALLVLAPLTSAATLDPYLERLSEEAEAFATTARRMVATETLVHRAVKAPPRFLPRIGAAATTGAQIITRRIVSEFGYSAMAGSPGDLREFRKVVEVDGKPAADVAKARLELASNMTSEDDRRRKQMLQNFERLGMVGAATDFSQIILRFRRAELPKYEFRYSARNILDSQAVSILVFRQKSKDDGARVFHDKELEVVPIEGEIWMRDSDSRPLRIVTRIVTEEYGLPVLHAAETEYRVTASGALAPVLVRYTRTQEKTVNVENYAAYTAHKIFTVDTEIKFTPDEATAETPPQQP